MFLVNNNSIIAHGHALSSLLIILDSAENNKNKIVKLQSFEDFTNYFEI